MRNHIYYNPTKILFGQGMEAETGKEIREFGGSKVLFHHYGDLYLKESGLYDKIMNSLGESKLEVIELTGVKPNPRDDLVREGAELCKKENIDFILAVGGGSVIDSSKAIAMCRYYEGDFKDFYTSKAVCENALPVGVVLTIPGAGSESSGDSVITFLDEGIKRGASSPHIRPKFSILNPEVTFTLPERLSLCGIVDAITHVHERYFTNERYVDATDRMCEGLIKTLMKYGMEVQEDPNNYQVRAEIMWASKIVHDGTLGVGRVEDWASHSIEHEISSQYDITHAAGLAVINPNWMKYVYKNNIDRFIQYANRVFDVPTEGRDPEGVVLEGIAKFQEFLSKMKMPLTMRDLGITEKTYFKVMADKVTRYTGGTEGNFVKLTAADVEAIYELAY